MDLEKFLSIIMACKTFPEDIVVAIASPLHLHGRSILFGTEHAGLKSFSTTSFICTCRTVVFTYL